MPAARSLDAIGSYDAEGSMDSGGDGMSMVGQETVTDRKSFKRAAESSVQEGFQDLGKEEIKTPGRSPKRSKAQEEEMVIQLDDTDSEPALVSLPDENTQDFEQIQSVQKSSSREVKTLLENGRFETLSKSVGLGRLRKRKDLKDVTGTPGTNEKDASEEGRKVALNHTKSLALVGAPGSSHAKRRRKRRRHGKGGAEVDEKIRVTRRIKNLVNRIRLEQNLIDAYAGEGWKGQSREKLKPEKELKRAESQILRCKLGIRESIHELDTLGKEGSLQQSAFDEEGRIYHEEIFCAKCKSQEAHIDNDIILCDGACDRGFHQYCLEPPLATADIPPGDEGWLCPVCDSKAECLNYINGYMGTDFQVDDQWEDVFVDEAAKAAGLDASNAAGEDWPSEDSEDDDYNPEKSKVAVDGDEEERKGTVSFDSLSGSESESEATSGSSVSCDDESDESPVSGDELELQSARPRKKRRRSRTVVDVEEALPSPKVPSVALDAQEEEVVTVSGKRHRKPVDYKKLHDEMFGKEDLNLGDQVSEDEEWGPGRDRRRGKAEVGIGSLDNDGIGNIGGHDEPDAGEAKRSRGRKSNTSQVGSHGSGSEEQAGQQQSLDVKNHRRLPDKAVEVLRREFSSGIRFPTRSQKLNLTKSLGISYQQISSWFKNARHSAKSGHGSNVTEKVPRKSNGVADTPREQVPVEEGNEEPADHAMEEMEMTNALLVEKLDEVQMKLQQLKQTLEAVVSSSEPPDRNRDSVMSADGKRVVYVPKAEVVEKSTANL